MGVAQAVADGGGRCRACRRPGRCRVLRVGRELPEAVLGVGTGSGIEPEKDCVGERALGGA